MKTVVGFVRHGVTDWNIERRIQGHSDIPLNEQGKKQAAAIAERLKGEPWDVIVSSDLSRAYVTATTIAEALQLEVEVNSELREIYCGEAEGTVEEERIERWGKKWRELELGMESGEAVGKRGAACVTKLVEKYEGRNILVVSHGALIGHTLKQLVPDENTDEHLHNTSLTIVEFAANRWSCTLYNCHKHLDVHMKTVLNQKTS